MFKTLQNAWKIPELRKKLLFTLFIVVLYRVGASIPVPYVSPDIFVETQQLFSGSILQFLNILSGEALGKATLLALGVSPYITSSIVIQLLTVAFPESLGKWAKDGEEGKKKLTALTRIITVVLALITAIGYAFFLDQSDLLITSGNTTFFHYMVIVLCYCAGAALVMWMAEKINESGIGNGISIILFANILSGGASMVGTLWYSIFTKGGFEGFDAWGLVLSLSVLVVFLGLIVLIVWMSDAERRIPIQYAKRVVGRKMYGGQNSNLPLKVNMTGVMPIIFANSIVAVPATIVSFLNPSSLPKWLQWMKGAIEWVSKAIMGDWNFVETLSKGYPKTGMFVQSLVSFNYSSWPYLLVFLVLLIAFAYFYVAISFNPVEVANNIKNNGGAVPGIRVGRPTVEFIKKVLYRVTLVGALLVAFIACFPLAVNSICTIFGFAGFQTLAFGGSSIMIVVGVALETVRELEAQMTLRNYKGFLD